MSSFLTIPRSAFDESLWRDGNLSRLYIFLLSQVNAQGIVEISLRDISRHTRLSLQAVRTALSRLKSTQRITCIPTHVLTQITICDITQYAVGATHNPTQRATQKKTRVDASSSDDDFMRFMEYFNNGFAGTHIPKITKFTAQRKTALRSIIKEYGRDKVDEALRKVYASDFLMGRNTKWHATFDWIFNKTNFQKILENNYVNRSDSRQCTYSGDGQRRSPTTYDLAREILGESAD